MTEAAEQIAAILRRYAVYGHYKASVRAQKYAVFRKRADGSSECVSEPVAHAEAQAHRERLIVADLLELMQ